MLATLRSVPLALPGGLRRAGGRPALIHRGTEISAAELADRVEARTAELGSGRRLVMIAGANRPELVITHLAALAGGHVSWLVPSAEGAGALAERFRPDVVAAPDGHGVALEHRAGAPAHDLHPDLAMLMGTSGSTGTPRLVRLSHANLQSNAEAIATYLGLGPSDRAITSLPMHYCYGLSVLHSHLHAGAGVVLTERSVSDAAFWGLVREHAVTGIAGVPHTFSLLERAGFADMHLPSLRYLTQAGGRMEPARVRRYAELGARRGWELVVMYGQTEATARMAYLPPALAAAHPSCIGVPIPGGELELRADPDGDPGVGELVYRGPNVMMGYAEHPGDLARGRDVEELATGDLARRTDGGLYEIVGRRSRFLKLYGVRVDLAGVERMLAEEGVEAVCAGDDERLAIAVTGGACPAATGCLVAERIGVPVWRIGARHHDAIPRLPNGKPDYRAVADAAEPVAPPPGPSAAGAGAPLLRRLRRRRATSVAGVFAAALGRGEVAPSDTFAGLGGDSLTYVEVSLALEELLADVPSDWTTRTVAELEALRGAPASGGWLARVETGVALRAAAVLLVVAAHMTDVLPAGGAHLLLAIAGYQFARLTLAGSGLPGRLRRALAGVARIAVPSAVWIGLVMVTMGGYSLGTLLLVNNYTGDASFSGGRWHYWFIESLVQLLLLSALVFSVPAVRRWEARAPFAFACALLVPALALRFAAPALPGGGERALFQPHAVAWLFLLGWAAQRARTPAQRVVVSAALLVATPGFSGDPAREAVVAGGMLALLWVPAVRVPRPAVRPLGLVASASLFIYLTHWQVWPALPEALPVPALVAACTVAGIGAWALSRWVEAAARRALAAARRDPASVRGNPATAGAAGRR